MVEYKHYDRSYEDEVLKVFTESFVNYPLFWGVFENRFKSKAELRSFYECLLKGIFKATVRKDDCYMCIADGMFFNLRIENDFITAYEELGKKLERLS